MESHLASAASLVFLPFAFVQLAIRVRAGTLAVSPVVLVATIVIASIRQHEFDFAFQWHGSLFKSAFDDLVLPGVKDTWAVRLVVPPFTFVEGTTFELAKSCAVAQIILEASLVDVAGARVEGSLAIPHVFRQVALILVNRLLLDGLQLCETVINKINPSPIDAGPKSVRHLERIFNFKWRRNIITQLQFDARITNISARIMTSIKKIFQILLLFAITIRLVEASEHLHHFIMRLFICISNIVHPIHKSGVAVEISAGFRHQLYVFVQRLILGRVFCSVSIITILGTNNPRIMNIRRALLD